MIEQARLHRGVGARDLCVQLLATDAVDEKEWRVIFMLGQTMQHCIAFLYRLGKIDYMLTSQHFILVMYCSNLDCLTKRSAISVS